MNETNVTRRTAIVAGALGAVAVAAMPKIASAAPAAGEAKANQKVVKDFIAAWDDPDKAASFLADDASVRMVEDQPAVIGPKAVAAAFKSFMTPGVTISVKVLATFAEGPVVTNKRIDTMKTPGKPDQAFKVVGVFVVKNGKIKEWADYLDT